MLIIREKGYPHWVLPVVGRLARRAADDALADVGALVLHERALRVLMAEGARVRSLVFAVVSAAAFGLAQAHVLKPGAPRPRRLDRRRSATPYRGETVFQQTLRRLPRRRRQGRRGRARRSPERAHRRAGQGPDRRRRRRRCLRGLVTGQDEEDVRRLRRLDRRPVDSADVEVDARIVRLRLAETFVISRESHGRRRRRPGLDHPRRRHRARRGGADRALRARRPTRRSRSSSEHGGLVGDDPFALEEIGERLAEIPGEQAAKCALDAALHDLQGKLLGVPAWRLLGLPRAGPADVVDGLARRSRRHGAPGRGGRRALPPAQAQARRRRRARRRARPRGPRRSPPCRCRSTSTSGGRSTRRSTRCRSSPSSASSTASSRSARATRAGSVLKERSPIPIYVDEDCHTLADVAALRADRARHQHQAREVRRDPRGDPDGARGPGARARRDARLHDRVGSRDRRRLLRRAALRPRRPRRQPPARARTRARASTSSTACRSRPTGRVSASHVLSRPALLILAEGFSARPALRQDDARRHPLPAGRRRRHPRLDAGGGDHDGVPDRRHRRRGAVASSRRSRSWASPPRAAASRRRGASCCGRCIRARARDRERPARVPHRRRGAEPSSQRDTASRSATCAGRRRARLSRPARTSRSRRRSCSPSARTARSGR